MDVNICQDCGEPVPPNVSMCDYCVMSFHAEQGNDGPAWCTCGIPSEANIYASGVILGDDYTNETDAYLCTDHAGEHEARIRATLAADESLVEYTQTELR